MGSGGGSGGGRGGSCCAGMGFCVGIVDDLAAVGIVTDMPPDAASVAYAPSASS